MSGRVDALLEQVAAWAAAQQDVRAVVLVGSQARTATPADAFSDVDLAIVVDDPPRYVRDGAWVAAFGEPLLSFVEPTAVGGFEERRVLYRDGLEVDFSVLPSWVAASLPADAADVLRAGYRVLYDELGLALAEARGTPEAAGLTQPQFEQLSHDVWYHLLWAAKKLARGEVLLAKQVCDCYVVARVVELARWQSHGSETWHGFRFFERWADAELREHLPETFARYDAADVARALRATAALQESLEASVAQRYALAPPVDRAAVLEALDEVLDSAPATAGAA